jgi:hypothetical protein
LKRWKLSNRVRLGAGQHINVLKTAGSKPVNSSRNADLPYLSISRNPDQKLGNI